MSDLIDREALLRQIDIDSEGEPGYYGDTWKFIDTIKSMPPAEHGTNLAEVGTDCISRQKAISAICNACGKIDCDKMDKCEKLQLPPANCSEFPNNSDTISRQAAIDATKKYYRAHDNDLLELIAFDIERLPSAQPEIIRCRNCKFASGDSRICMKFDHSPIGELDFCAWAERRTDGRFNQQAGGD